VIRNRYVAGKGLSLQTPLAETLPPIYGDRIQLLQVIGNLMINPVEAYQRRRRRIAGIAHQHHQD